MDLSDDGGGGAGGPPLPGRLGPPGATVWGGLGQAPAPAAAAAARPAFGVAATSGAGGGGFSGGLSLGPPPGAPLLAGGGLWSGGFGRPAADAGAPPPLIRARPGLSAPRPAAAAGTAPVPTTGGTGALFSAFHGGG